MFAGVLSAFIVGNIIPDEAWESLASDGMEEETKASSSSSSRQSGEGAEEGEKKPTEGGGMFDDY